MSILQNAIDSISIGLEDFELSQNDKRRLISSTRNIFAGILLLFKHKLSILSPKNSDEVLIKQKVIPKINDNELIWAGKGRKTVDVQNIKDRFENLNIKIDWETDFLLNAIINFSCINCGSDLISVEASENSDVFICRSCEEKYTLELISEEALSQLYKSYNSDGSEPELTTCPFCLKETYLYYEHQCAFCGETASHECIRCGQDILADEISDDNLCGYCKYQYEKLMKE